MSNRTTATECPYCGEELSANVFEGDGIAERVCYSCGAWVPVDPCAECGGIDGYSDCDGCSLADVGAES